MEFKNYEVTYIIQGEGFDTTVPVDRSYIHSDGYYPSSYFSLKRTHNFKAENAAAVRKLAEEYMDETKLEEIISSISLYSGSGRRICRPVGAFLDSIIELKPISTKGLNPRLL